MILTAPPGFIVKAISHISRAVNYAALAILVIMMLLTVSDVIMRYITSRTIAGSTELTEYMMVCVVFLGLGLCAANGKHIKVDLLVSHFSEKAQAINDSIMHFLILIISVLIAWNGFREAEVTRELNIESTLLGIPSFPFYLIMAFGCAILAIVVLAQLITYIGKAVKG